LEAKRKQDPPILNEKSDIVTDSTDSQRIIRDYYTQFYVKKDNLDEMTHFSKNVNYKSSFKKK
jgi:hypothetical protein